MTPQTTTEILIGALAFQGILIVVLDWRRSTWKRRATGRDPMGLAERIALTEGDLIATRADRDALQAEIDRLDAVVHAPGDDAATVDAALAMIDRAETALGRALGEIVTWATCPECGRLIRCTGFPSPNGACDHCQRVVTESEIETADPILREAKLLAHVATLTDERNAAMSREGATFHLPERAQAVIDEHGRCVVHPVIESADGSVRLFDGTWEVE